MARPVIFGDASHPHVRSITFALAEKDIIYTLVPREQAPLLTTGGEQRIPLHCNLGEPALEYRGTIVSGADTVLRFVDDAFAGPRLQPADPLGRARMNRVMELYFREAVHTMGRQVAYRYVVAFLSGEYAPDLSERSLVQAQNTVAEFERLLAEGPFFAGVDFSLADIAIGSLFEKLSELADFRTIVARESALDAWWQRVSSRSVLKVTQEALAPVFGLMHAA